MRTLLYRRHLGGEFPRRDRNRRSQPVEGFQPPRHKPTAQSAFLLALSAGEGCAASPAECVIGIRAGERRGLPARSCVPPPSLRKGFRPLSDVLLAAPEARLRLARHAAKQSAGITERKLESPGGTIESRRCRSIRISRKQSRTSKAKTAARMLSRRPFAFSYMRSRNSGIRGRVTSDSRC